MTQNRVKWLPWNKNSFTKAQELDIPILLGISAVWCHWCHVMDETTYSNKEVVEHINENFIPIRVNRDRRPDIDKRYNMGGWPSTVFLTPEGEILTGGTYIPPQQMMLILDQVNRSYKKNKIELKTKIKLIQEKQQKYETQRIIDDVEFHSITDYLTFEITSQFDPVHGGFGSAPKFPHSEALRFILLQYFLKNHNAALNIVKKTLLKMGEGGIFDKEEGGFFRYSTTNDWSVPHYEKMCEDNAKLLINYLEASQITGETAFKNKAKNVLEYIDSKLSNKENGGFYGSQDADEVYYKLKLPERSKKIPPKIDQTIFTDWNAMMSSAYLLASVVLADQKYQNFALKTIDYILRTFKPTEGIKHYINEEKNEYSGFLTDHVYITKCLIDSYQITSNQKFLDIAENIAEFMIKNLWDKNGGFYDKTKKINEIGALKQLDKPLGENSVAADTFLRLYHLTDKSTYLEKAKKTLNYFATNYKRYGITAASYGLAVELYMNPMKINIIGSKEDEKTHQFLTECLKTYNPLKVLEIVDPEKNSERLELLGYPETERPITYVCYEKTCKSIKNPEKISSIIGGKTDG